MPLSAGGRQSAAGAKRARHRHLPGAAAPRIHSPWNETRSPGARMRPASARPGSPAAAAHAAVPLRRRRARKPVPGAGWPQASPRRRRTPPPSSALPCPALFRPAPLCPSPSPARLQLSLVQLCAQHTAARSTAQDRPAAPPPCAPPSGVLTRTRCQPQLLGFSLAVPTILVKFIIGA
jgi:hypothetical protein